MPHSDRLDVKTARLRPVDGDEQDAFSRRARHVLTFRAGARRRAKRAHNRRTRHAIKVRLTHSEV